MSRTTHHASVKRRMDLGLADCWLWSEPKWHRKVFKHQKRRTELKRVFNKATDWDNAVFPLDKKPWVYYWALIYLILCFGCANVNPCYPMDDHAVRCTAIFP